MDPLKAAIRLVSLGSQEASPWETRGACIYKASEAIPREHARWLSCRDWWALRFVDFLGLRMKVSQAKDARQAPVYIYSNWHLHSMQDRVLFSAWCRHIRRLHLVALLTSAEKFLIKKRCHEPLRQLDRLKPEKAHNPAFLLLLSIWLLFPTHDVARLLKTLSK